MKSIIFSLYASKKKIERNPLKETFSHFTNQENLGVIASDPL